MFSYDDYSAILGAVQAAGYNFRRLDAAVADPAAAAPIFFLRHDVDCSPRCALTLGRIEKAAGIQANYFFQINAETYNFFSRDVIALMRELQELGHCVGLHVDQPLLGEEEEHITGTLAWLRREIIPLDNVVSFHRPTPSVLGRSYAAFVNAYDWHFFDAETYLSDSGRNDAFYPRLLELLARRSPRIQLLLHPEWWYPIADLTQFWVDLRDRRVDELRRYALANFGKVLGQVVPNEDRTFGL